MRVLLVSHTYLPAQYRGKLRWLAAQPAVDLTLLAQPRLRMSTGVDLRFEAGPEPFAVRLLSPLAFADNNSLRLYNPLTLATMISELRPDIVHVEAEPHSLLLALIAWLKPRFNYRLIAFTWENIHRHGRWPLSQLEWPVLRRVDWMLTGNQEAISVMRWRGFRGPISVVPQVGLDLDHVAKPRPLPPLYHSDDGQRVGFAGRLVAEKGALDLLEAFAPLAADATLVLIGEGPLRETIVRRAAELGIAGRVRLAGHVTYRDMPAFLRGLDMLVLPSRTTANWKEQFGRVLPEAMINNVPVIGSDSGAIPEVIGDAGLIFPEGDVQMLSTQIRRLLDSPDLARRLGSAGEARARTHYSDDVIAKSTLDVYHQLLEHGV